MVKRLTTLPGIGPIIASAFVAALDTVSRFERAGQVTSYRGLADVAGHGSPHRAVSRMGAGDCASARGADSNEAGPRAHWRCVRKQRRSLDQVGNLTSRFIKPPMRIII
jgi:transposase